MDEHAELGVAEPLHALVALLLGLVKLGHIRQIHRPSPVGSQEEQGRECEDTAPR
jgi:hypothetical protein